MKVSRQDVLRYRVHVQQLDRAQSKDAAVLDLGVQDTGSDGAAWALRIRGYEPREHDLFHAWTLRGAPHVYRRGEAAQVAAATWPVSDTDAGKRIFDASRPLKAAGIGTLDALENIAAEMRDIVRSPTVKGDMSGELSRRMPEPYNRFCRTCDAVHLYEQPFRISALHAGLELQPGTSPPVLERIIGWRGPAQQAPQHLDPVRAFLHLMGPATPKQTAAYLDSPVKDVSARWPDDVDEIEVDGETRHVLTADVDRLAEPPATDAVRLLGPFDPFLQVRDRELVVPHEAHRKDIWRTLGRPGAVLRGHEVVGTWRPKTSGKKLTVVVDRWSRVAAAAVEEQAERLAAFRGVTLIAVTDA